MCCWLEGNQEPIHQADGPHWPEHRWKFPKPTAGLAPKQDECVELHPLAVRSVSRVGCFFFFLILHCAGDFLIENSAVFSCIKTRGDDLKLHQGCSGLDIRKNFSWKNGNALAQTAKRGGGVTVLRDVQETWRNGTDDCDFGDTMGTGWWLGFVILVVFSNLGDSVVLSFCFSLRLLVLMHTPSKKALSVSVLSLISPTHTSLCTNPFVPEKTSITEVIGTIASAFDVTSSGFLQSTCQFKPWLSC